MKVLKLLWGFESWGLLKFGRVLKLISGWDSISWRGVKVFEQLKLILGVCKVLEESKG